MSQRLGDNFNLAPVGWSLFINGLVGTDITPEESVPIAKDYLKGF
jgi:hypothetical protein